MTVSNRTLHVVRAALARGPLTPVRDRPGGHLRFGQRLFSFVAVDQLVATGEAVRRADGSVVRANVD